MGTFEWDRGSNRVTWSAALQRLHGHAPGSFSGTFEDAFADAHPEDREQVLATIDRALEHPGTPFHLTYRVILPSGAVRWLEAYGEVLEDAAGHAAGIRGVCRDVTSERAFNRLRETAYAINRALARAATITEGLDDVIATVGQSFDGEFTGCWAVDPVSGTLRLRNYWVRTPGAHAEFVEASCSAVLAPGQGLPGLALERDSSVWIEDIEGAESFLRQEAALKAGLRCCFAFPIRGTTGVTGVIEWFGRTPIAPDDAMLDSLNVIATDASQFVRRLSAEERVGRRERQQAAVARLGRLALESVSTPQLFDEAVSLLAETLGAQYAKVLQLLPGGEELRLVSGVGWQEGLVGHATVSTGTESQAGYTLRAGGAVIVRDLRTESRFNGPTLLTEHGVISGMSTVIRGQDGAWGVLGVHTREERAFTEDDTAFLESVANVLATAVERADRERAQAFLLQASEKLSASLDYEATLRELARLAVEEIADWCVVHLVEGGDTRAVEVAHRDPARVELVRQYRDQVADRRPGPLLTQVLETGRPLLIGSVDQETVQQSEIPAETVELIQELGLRSLVFAPFASRGARFGAITLVAAESSRRFTSADVAFAEELARRATSAIENARLYRESEQARAEVERRAAREAAVAELSREALFTGNFWHLMQQVCDRLLATLDVDRTAAFELFPGRDILIRAGAGWPPQVVADRIFTDAALPEVVAALDAPDTLAWDALEKTDETAHSVLVTEYGVRSAMIVSIPGPKRPWGALAAFCNDEREFSDDERQFLRAVAGLLAAAVEMRRYYRSQEQFARIAAALSRHLDARSLTAELVEQCFRVAPTVDWAAYWPVRPDGQVADPVTRHRDGLRQELLVETARRVPAGTVDEVAVRSVLRTRQPRLHTLITDEELDAAIPDPELRAQLRELGIVSALLVPVQTPERLFGVLAMASGDRTRPYGDHDVASISLIAERAALAFHSAELLEAANREREILTVIESVNRVISAELDRGTLVQAVVDAATRVAGADFGTFWYRAEQDRGPQQYALSGIDEATFEESTRPYADLVLRRILGAEPSLRVDDIQSAGAPPEDIGLAPGAELPFRSYLAVPVIGRAGAVIGGIFLGHAAPGAFSERTERIVQGIAVQAAIAFDNARLYEQTREALRVREDFVAVASHELRNPLSTILGYTQRLHRLAVRGDYDESLVEPLSLIVAEADRMKNTLELFVDMARLESERFVPDVEETDLADLLTRELSRLRRRNGRAIVEEHLPGSLPVRTDAARIQTIVANLLSNAVKYGGDPPHITVTLEATRDGAAIRVRDNGPGIAPADREHMFERFFRSAQARTSGRPGLGLGLYLSRQIADRLGGSLTFESEEGAGTEFVLQVPDSAPENAGAPDDH